MSKLHTLKCSNCDKELVEVITHEASIAETRLLADCPFCGDVSFALRIANKFSIGPCDDTMSIVKYDPMEDGFKIRMKKNEY